MVQDFTLNIQIPVPNVIGIKPQNLMKETGTFMENSFGHPMLTSIPETSCSLKIEIKMNEP